MKTVRHTSRSQALQVLYQLDVQKNLTLDTGLDYFRANFESEGAEAAFVERLIKGVMDRLKEIDAKIEEAASHWRVDRMGRVDRNVLRMGVFELLYCDEIPATVSINEMIELAKSFADEDSPKFVNAVLDRIRINNPVPNKAP
ncbi:MAG: transcription antitermination factor NusB [Deltaproteobacteria bacterium]|nr:transcription antitermination factor NusB [Deltaproteobacteria bacterium]MBI3294320.1 transcription antitermination factor NusB [Deltaproteobacteria bacterium]